jgi:hypothetical protein
LSTWARRVFGRLAGLELPAGFPGKVDADERILAIADVVDGGHAMATSRGLWLPDGDRARRIGWHLISKATWSEGTLTLIEATETGQVDGAFLLADLPARRLRLARPGFVPEAVHERVTGSIKSSHHRELPGGGAWVVQRTIAGQDGIVLQVRADPGTEEQAVRALAVRVADQIRRVRSGG